MKPRLTVIIVNYNVEFFLEQCLHSVEEASKEVTTEVIVVDNNSSDHSCSMVREKFPGVHLIENEENVGFSRANNQGITIAQGDYILLFNPDTLVEETAFERMVTFMDTHDDAGGLGVRMIDGKGNFLPESKRGLPKPMVAFYKIFGLSALFPKSKTFGRYHLGYLDEHETNEVDILSGACMLIRKQTIADVGLLDEAFFMYGEDIDLSYRIQKAGYKNYYFPGTSIIHYKGESTKKSSINYVFVFYRAMIIFARKHFSSGNALLYSFFINLAIYFRAGVAIGMRFIRKSYPALLDFGILYLGFHVISNLYQQQTGIVYPEELTRMAFVLYPSAWIVSFFFTGAYDKPFSFRRMITGFVIGLAVILAAYGLLDESKRFSRAVIVLGSSYFLAFGFMLRYIYHLFRLEGYEHLFGSSKRILIVGGREESDRIDDLLEKTNLRADFIGRIDPDHHAASEDEQFVGNIEDLKEYVQMFDINEVIFCSRDIKSDEIIKQMSLLDKSNIDFKIAPRAAEFVIGSNSINTSGELYSVLHLNSITRPSNRRIKRSFDMVASLVVLALSPLLFWIQRRKSTFFANIFYVLFGDKSWVGYSNFQEGTLPFTKRGVLFPGMDKDLAKEERSRLDHIYAKNYSLGKDLNIFMQGITRLGN